MCADGYQLHLYADAGLQHYFGDAEARVKAGFAGALGLELINGKGMSLGFRYTTGFGSRPSLDRYGLKLGLQF